MVARCNSGTGDEIYAGRTFVRVGSENKFLFHNPSETLVYGAGKWYYLRPPFI